MDSLTQIFEFISSHLGEIAGLLTAAVVVLKALRTGQEEKMDLSGKAAESFASAAHMAAQDNVELMKRLDRIEESTGKLRLGFRDMATKNRALLDLMANWQRGVQILINQLRGLGYEPEWEPDPIDLSQFQINVEEFDADSD